MTEDCPGQWPADEPIDLIPDDLYMKRAAERGRREIVLGSIRAALEEQPSRASVLKAARRWCADVMATAYEVAKKFRSPG